MSEETQTPTPQPDPQPAPSPVTMQIPPGDDWHIRILDADGAELAANATAIKGPGMIRIELSHGA